MGKSRGVVTNRRVEEPESDDPGFRLRRFSARCASEGRFSFHARGELTSMLNVLWSRGGDGMSTEMGMERGERDAEKPSRTQQAGTAKTHDGVSAADRQPPTTFQEAMERGDHRAALAICVREHGESVGRLCMAMLHSQTEAEEVAQETLLAAYESFPSFRFEAPVRAWLLGIARKKCLKTLLQRRRHEEKSAELPPPSEPEGAEERIHRRRRAVKARAVLQQLKPTEREALLLRYQGELSYRGVAFACAVEEPTARKRVSRALLHLRAALEQWEATEAANGRSSEAT